MKTKRTAAITAGVSILAMTVAAGFSAGYVKGQIVDPDSASATLENIRAATGLFRAGIAGWWFILLTDLTATAGFYLYFRKENNVLSLLMGFSRLAYSLMLGLAILHLSAASAAATGAATLNTAELVMTGLQSFDRLWLLGLIIFGAHLLFLGMLAMRSENIHNAWGILLLVAGAGYLFIHTSKAILPEPGAAMKFVQALLAVPMTVGEVGFGIWMLVRGGRIRR